MQFETYKKDALRSETPLAEVKTDKALLIAVLKTAIAAGDLIDLMKKTVVYGRAMDHKEFSKRLTDIVDDASEARHLTRLPVPAEVVEVNPRLLHATLGTFGEAGEMFAALLHQINGEGLDLANIVEESGDGFWYKAVEVDEIEIVTGVTSDDILAKNDAKLRVRFPDKFSLAASEARDIGAERVAMEGVRAAT